MAKKFRPCASGAMYWAPWGWSISAVMSGIVFSLLSPAVRQHALDVGRHDFGGGAQDVFVEQGLVARRLEVQLDGARPRRLAADMQDEARRGIDLARGADRQEEAAALESCVDLVHVERQLAEPDDVWPELSHGLAVGADRLRREVNVGFEDRAAVHAADLAIAAVHVDHVLRARHLMQRV